MATSLASERRPVTDLCGGRYELLGRIGRGGTSVVWRARDTVTGRLVALKILDESHAGDRGLRQRILREAWIASTVSSPHVVRALGHGNHQRSTGEIPFVVMELVDGVTLQDRLNAGRLRPAVAMKIGAQVASALAAIHAAGVVHCDVKPANIMVAADATKVVDFGIAVHAGSEDSLSVPFCVMGTPAYLAPERLTGGAAHPPADIYALGVMLYRMLAGCVPWAGENTEYVLNAHLSKEPTPMPPRPGIPASVAALAHRCLAKDPAARPTGRAAQLVLSRGSRTNAETRSPQNMDELPGRRRRGFGGSDTRAYVDAPGISRHE